MSFTAIFIALLIERFFDCSHLRYWGWYPKLQRFMQQKLAGQSQAILLAATTIPVIIAVILLEWVLDDVGFGFFKLAFSVAIILYCFGPRNLWADTFACLNAITDGDASTAAEQLKKAFGISETEDAQKLHHRFVNAIFIESNRRVFATVFWFSFVGLLGVVFYRLISLSADDENGSSPTSSVARQIESYLDWPSVRVLGFIFALGGNYHRVFTCWRSKVTRGPDANEALLTECGMAALNTPIQEKLPINGAIEREEISLLDRSLGIILVAIAVLVFLIP